MHHRTTHMRHRIDMAAALVPGCVAVLRGGPTRGGARTARGRGSAWRHGIAAAADVCSSSPTPAHCPSASARATDALWQRETATARCRHHVDDDEDTSTEDGHDAHILPPHLAPEVGARLRELEGLLVQVIRLVNEEVDLFTAVEDLVDVVHHDRLDLVELALHLLHVWPVCLALAREHSHLLLQRGLERIRSTRKGHRGGVSMTVPPPLADLRQELERKNPAKVWLAHAHEDEAVVHEQVEHVLVILVRPSRVPWLPVHLLYDFARDSGEVARRTSIFAEHATAAGNDRVDDGH
mmetsp:Transcript_8010/g.22021  ORF Transcript_8010/g.22021 Transcript_8010/m.22021 type:complete len:295 (+) Transcript_8010:111-995(+)